MNKILIDNLVRAVPLVSSLPSCSPLPPLSNNVGTFYACAPEILSLPSPPWFSPRFLRLVPCLVFYSVPTGFFLLVPGGHDPLSPLHHLGVPLDSVLLLRSLWPQAVPVPNVGFLPSVEPSVAPQALKLSSSEVLPVLYRQASARVLDPYDFPEFQPLRELPVVRSGQNFR